ncbi:MAG TPA: hypothetical protein VM223_08330 [Planctomycetota bacterium]|nr:hypothetical protein [Planctomycetota bacterium]
MDRNHGNHDALSGKLRNLTRLGCALAMQADERIPDCVGDCLIAGATRAEIMEVLRMAILMPEIRVDKYTTIVSDAIERFEKLDSRGD